MPEASLAHVFPLQLYPQEDFEACSKYCLTNYGCWRYLSDFERQMFEDRLDSTVVNLKAC